MPSRRSAREAFVEGARLLHEGIDIRHPDVVAGARDLQERFGITLSDAVNELARLALRLENRTEVPFRQETFDLGLFVDVSNVEEALDLLEGPSRK